VIDRAEEEPPAPEVHAPSADLPAPLPETNAEETTAQPPEVPTPEPVPETLAADHRDEEPASEVSGEVLEEEDEEEEDEESEEEPVGAVAASEPEQQPNKKKWYVVKVQSGREEAIKEAIERRVKKDALEPFYGQIVIPVEKYTEVRVDKNNRRTTRTKERKLYPGYIMAEVEYNDRVLYLFRETSGVGDFVGASGDRDKPPPPMTDREIQRIMGPGPGQADGGSGDEKRPPPRPRGMNVGDRVKVIDGTFNGMEGEIKEVLEKVGHLKVQIEIFGRPVSVELEYFQVEQA